MSKTMLVVLADGFEDIEAIAPIDVLTRAGVKITIASLKPGPVKAAYGTTIVADTTIDKIDDHSLYDGIFFPGGRANAKALAEHPKVKILVHNHEKKGKIVSAICAAPSHVLAESAGILKGRRSSGDPSFNDKLSEHGAIVTGENVTVDGNIITGMGPGAAIPFALMLAEHLAGKKIADEFADKWGVNR